MEPLRGPFFAVGPGGENDDGSENVSRRRDDRDLENVPLLAACKVSRAGFPILASNPMGPVGILGSPWIHDVDIYPRPAACKQLEWTVR